MHCIMTILYKWCLKRNFRSIVMITYIIIYNRQKTQQKVNYKSTNGIPEPEQAKLFHHTLDHPQIHTKTLLLLLLPLVLSMAHLVLLYAYYSVYETCFFFSPQPFSSLLSSSVYHGVRKDVKILTTIVPQ